MQNGGTFKKRFLALALALCLILCLCACGKDTPDPADPTKAPAGSEQTPPADKPSEETETPYQILYNYIVENGEAKEDIWVYVAEVAIGDGVTMTASSDGKIWWEDFSPSGTMIWKLELQENSMAHTWSVTFGDFFASATLEDDGGTISNFQCSESGGVADTVRGWLESGVKGMMLGATQALEAMGLELADFIPPAPADKPSEEPPAEEPPAEEPPAEEPPAEEPPAEEPPVEELPEEKPELNIDPAILGRYRMYKMEDAYGKYDYNTVIGNHGYAYIQLNADGTADLCDRGEVLSGLEWDVKNMEIRGDNGQVLWPRIEGDTLTISQGKNKLIYVHEDSETWDSVPTGYQKLHDYIVKKGKKQNGSYVFSKSYDTYAGERTLNLIVDEDGVIWWEISGGDITVKLQLLEGNPVQSVTAVCNGYTCTASIELSSYIDYYSQSLFYDFQTDAGSDLAAELEDATKSAVSSLVGLAKSAMEKPGVSLAYLCYTSLIGDMGND